jgi:site-specific recombinase XerD
VVEFLPSKQVVAGSSPVSRSTKLTGVPAYDKIADFYHLLSQDQNVGCRRGEAEPVTVSDALTAYRMCARAEGKSPKTIEWVDSSVRLFAEFMGGDPEVTNIAGNDLRRFIIALQSSNRYRKHPYAKPQQEKLSAESIRTYARGVRAFFGNLHQEGFIDNNPMEGLKMPKSARKIVATFSEKELVKLLSQPNKNTDRGFRDYALLLTFVDTAARLSEIANLKVEDVDFDNVHLKVLGKGAKERYIPFGRKVAKILLKYKLRHRPEPIATDRFFLTVDGGALTAERIQKIIGEYGVQAGLKRCYAHKLRHSSSLLYLRCGGDAFTLQKKLGHSSLQMTRHYCELADADVRAAQLKHSPADRLHI